MAENALSVRPLKMHALLRRIRNIICGTMWSLYSHQYNFLNSGGERRIRDLHSILGLRDVLAAGAGIHACRAARDQGQVVCLHPSPITPRSRAGQRQKTHHSRVLVTNLALLKPNSFSLFKSKTRLIFNLRDQVENLLYCYLNFNDK